MDVCLHHILRRPVTLAMTCCAVAFGGVLAMTQIPLGLAPAREFPALSISMGWGGAAAENVERVLTAPVEEIVSSLRGIRKVRSVSREGGARVSAEFDQRTDMTLVRLELNERLSMFARQLPRGASHPVLERYIPQDLEGLQGFLSYTLSGPLPRPALARLADKEIIPLLTRIEGVAQVLLYGEEEQELRVELSPEKLTAAGIAPGDVVAALAAFRPGSCAATLRGPAGVEGISYAAEANVLPVMENILVRRGDRPGAVRLGDVATLGVVPPGRQELYRVNGKESLTLTVVRDPNSSMPATAREVRRRLAGLLPRLPSGVHLICEADQSRRMTLELGLLYRDLSVSLILLWGTLVLFLGSNRAPLILVLSVLLSLAGTLLVLWMLNISLHILTLAGIVLGMGRLLDDSIVVLENLRRWGEHAVTTESIVKGVREVAVPVVASTVATAGAMVPVFFLPRNLQIYLQEFALAVAVSLFISLLVSFSVVPSAAWRWKMGRREVLVRSYGLVVSLYRRLLGGALRHRVLVLTVAVWTFGLPVWLLPARIDSGSPMAMLYNKTIGGPWFSSARPVVHTLLGGLSYQFFRNVPHAELLDPEAETFLLVEVHFPQGTDIAREDTVARLLEENLLRAGAPRLTTRVLGGLLLLRIEFPDSTIPSALPRTLRSHCFRLAAQIGGAAVSVAGFGAGFSSGVDLQSAFTVRVLGYDYTRVKEIAELLRERLLRNPRVVCADINRSFGGRSAAQEIALVPSRETVERYGLTAQEIALTLQSRTGDLARRIAVNVQGDQLSCVVSVSGSKSLSLTELGSIAVPAKRSAPVPLRSLLSVRQRAAPTEIVREDQQYVRWVSFEYKGPYRHAQAFLDATIGTFRLPEGYRLDRDDSSGVSGKDQGPLLLAALAALLIVFMATASLYESLLDPFIIMLSVPFAYIGVFAAFLLAGVPFGRGGYLSVIFLTGIAVANAIVIVDFISKKRKEGNNRPEAIVEASVCRLRPVLMTTLTTAGGLVPMLLGERASLWYPMALGTFGGVLSSALLTLIVIPVVYAVAHKLSPTPPLRREGIGVEFTRMNPELTLPPFFRIFEGLEHY